MAHLCSLDGMCVLTHPQPRLHFSHLASGCSIFLQKCLAIQRQKCHVCLIDSQTWSWGRTKEVLTG